MIPALDEAQALAERLRDELAAAAAAAREGTAEQRKIGRLADDADDLTSRIDLTRSGNQ